MISKALVRQGIKVVQEFWKCDKWHECMNDPTVEIQKKYLLNGIRYMYSSYIAQKLESLANKNNGEDIPSFLKVVPTGSTNVTSDIDTQIMVNIYAFSRSSEVKRSSILQNIVRILSDGKQLWHVDSIAESLDINLYPAALINYEEVKPDVSPIIRSWLYYGKGKDNTMVCFRPQLQNITLREEFIRNDHQNTKKRSVADMNTYYTYYCQYTSAALLKLTHEYELPGSAKEINDLIFELVHFNQYADEVYFAVSTIIIVVWHMQLGNPIRSRREMSALCVNAFVENYNMFRATKKDKYKQRYEYALRKIIPNEYIGCLNQTHQNIIRTSWK